MISNKSRTFISTECIFTNEPWTLPAVLDMSANPAQPTASAGGAKCTSFKAFRCLSPFLHFVGLLHTWKDSSRSSLGSDRWKTPDQPNVRSGSVWCYLVKHAWTVCKTIWVISHARKTLARTCKVAKQNERSWCFSISLGIDRSKITASKTMCEVPNKTHLSLYTVFPHLTPPNTGSIQTVGFMARQG